jgi:hypothetical protein
MACLLGCGVLGLAAPAWGFYDAFPADGGPYVSGPAGVNLPWRGEDFESFTNGQIIESESDKSTQPHLDVTSGTLDSKYVDAWRRGWTDDYDFRMVALGYDNLGRRIKWTDQVAEYRGNVRSWHADPPDWAGFHLFLRYQTSNDLYVASVRYDGQVTIKRKWDSDHNGEGEYTDLATGTLNGDYLDGDGRLKTRQWFRLRFAAIGDELSFYVDDQLLLSATDGTFSWGTTGVRIDYANAYLDEWRLIYDAAPEPASASLLVLGGGLAAGLSRGRRPQGKSPENLTKPAQNLAQFPLPDCAISGRIGQGCDE